MNEPNIITSSKSQNILVDKQSIRIEIYKLEHENVWTLEVVDEQGTSIVWDELFNSDQDALSMALRTIKKEGISAFDEGKTHNVGDNIIPFKSDK